MKARLMRDCQSKVASLISLAFMHSAPSFYASLLFKNIAYYFARLDRN